MSGITIGNKGEQAMINIRSIIFLFTLVFALGALAQQPQAQDDKQSDQAHAKRGNMPNSEALLKHLTEALNLTDNQQTAVKAILWIGWRSYVQKAWFRSLCNSKIGLPAPFLTSI